MVRRMAAISVVLCTIATAFGQEPSRIPIPLPQLDLPPVVSPTIVDPDPLPRNSLQLPFPPPTIPDSPPSGVGPPVRPTAPRNEELFLTEGSRVNLPNARNQILRFSPRYGNLGKFDFIPIGDGTQRLIYTGGLIINITYEIAGRKGPVAQEFEFAADNLVVWIKGLNGKNAMDGLATQNEPTGDKPMEIEMFLTGNVVVRSKDETLGTFGQKSYLTRTLRAEQIYYDVNKNKAIALKADLELAFDHLKDSVHLYAERINRLGKNEWNAKRAGVYSSKLPSDPSIEFLSRDIEFVERETVRRNIFGIPYRSITTGEVDYGSERVLTGRNTRLEVLGVPIFYTPYSRTDPAEPLGPLSGIGFGNDRIFGRQFYSTFDMYKLLALRGPDNHNWKLHLDYLTDRGPAFGTDYTARDPNFFGFGGAIKNEFRLYGIPDKGIDVLGGDRGIEPKNPSFRGRALWRTQFEILADRDPEGNFLDGRRHVTLQRQLAYVSDKNYIEQYFKQEFDLGYNQESFLNLAASDGKWHGSILAQGGQKRDWITETRWLPKVSASLVGQSFFDLFSYNSRANAGYAQFRPTTISPFALLPTEQQRLDTGRLDWMQELSLPVRAGPVNVVPYGLLDLTGYSNDLSGEQRGRIYGGGGLRSSVSVSQLYPDAASELFNVKSLFHKATLHSDYRITRTNTPFGQLPLLDRLNDDAIDQAYRTITPAQTFYTKGAAGLALSTSPIFNPQRYAIRRGVDNRVDTLDELQVFRVGVDQRLQTKRGFPGREHTIDWMSLDLSASVFPNADKDNFGKSVSFLEYNYIWNVGDQTALTASGWFDPFDFGARYWNVGAYFSRPDNTNFFLGYRQIEPVNSKAVTASFGYQLTKKYGVNVASTYDFGTQLALSNTLTIVRTGPDLSVYLGLTYNALVNNFGIQFSVVPNLAAGTGAGRVGSPFIQQ